MQPILKCLQIIQVLFSKQKNQHKFWLNLVSAIQFLSAILYMLIVLKIF